MHDRHKFQTFRLQLTIILIGYEEFIHVREFENFALSFMSRVRLKRAMIWSRIVGTLWVGWAIRSWNAKSREWKTTIDNVRDDITPEIAGYETINFLTFYSRVLASFVCFVSLSSGSCRCLRKEWKIERGINEISEYYVRETINTQIFLLFFLLRALFVCHICFAW